MTLPLRVVLDQCRQHAAVMRAALADLPKTLSRDAIAQDDLSLLRAIDQFVYRLINKWLNGHAGDHRLAVCSSRRTSAVLGSSKDTAASTKLSLARSTFRDT